MRVWGLVFPDSRQGTNVAKDKKKLKNGKKVKKAKKGAERGNALWQMALEIGRRSLEELAESGSSRGKARRK